MSFFTWQQNLPRVPLWDNKVKWTCYLTAQTLLHCNHCYHNEDWRGLERYLIAYSECVPKSLTARWWNEINSSSTDYTRYFQTSRFPKIYVCILEYIMWLYETIYFDIWDYSPYIFQYSAINAWTMYSHILMHMKYIYFLNIKNMYLAIKQKKYCTI